MKTFKFKQTKKEADINELCATAAVYFWVFCSEYADEDGMFETIEGISLPEAFEKIRTDLNSSNEFKTATATDMKKVLKKNFRQVKLYSDLIPLINKQERDFYKYKHA